MALAVAERRGGRTGFSRSSSPLGTQPCTKALPVPGCAVPGCRSWFKGPGPGLQRSTCGTSFCRAGLLLSLPLLPGSMWGSLVLGAQAWPQACSAFRWLNFVVLHSD